MLIVTFGLAAACACALAQEADNSAPLPVSPFNEQRIAGVIPDYQTVRESSGHIAPLTTKQKWDLAWKESIDPFNIASAAMTAGFAQMGNQTPSYGDGATAYAKRFGAAQADFDTQNVLSAGVFANLLHQDPRYFRRGNEYGYASRVLYSVSRLVVARQDSGKAAFNASNILGILVGIAASNAYYPAASRTGTVMTGRLGTTMMGGAIGNLMSEFWPDIQNKVFRHKSTHL